MTAKVRSKAQMKAKIKPKAKTARGPSDDPCKKQPFTYDNGPLGQRNWCGDCNLPTSRLQAPINIETAEAIPVAALPLLNFSGYQPTRLVTDEYFYNLKVNYSAGNSALRIGNEFFQLLEFHFHRPAEEAIDNHRAAMVAHLVHANADSGPFKVVTVLIEEGPPASNTEALVNTLIRHFPLATGPQDSPNVLINAADLLPGHLGYYRYEGSLTTPGCSENVTFYVLKVAINFSSDQLTQFERRYTFPNSRNVQATNGRRVEQTVFK